MTLSPLAAATIAAGLAFVLHRIDAKSHRYARLDALIDGLPLCLACLAVSGLIAAAGRPLFSLMLSACGSAGLFAANRLKLALFGEPLLCLDAFLAEHVLRHPRFYVPLLFPPPILAGQTVFLGAAVWLFATEPVLPAFSRLMAALVCLGCLLALAGAVVPLWMRSGRGRAERLLARRSPDLTPVDDLHRFGLIGSFLLHMLWRRHVRGLDGALGVPARKAASCRRPPAADAPHILLVQAESFFDPRGVLPEAPPQTLSWYDRLRQEGGGGVFQVETHGAYTMRTEYSVLTGLPLAALGADAFNPYVAAATHECASSVWTLRENGHRTVFMHPFEISFFRRDRVMPNLGFERLIDETAFREAPRFGPYVSDLALADAALDELAKSSDPTFLFVVTMEAHGPWAANRFERSAFPDSTEQRERLRKTDPTSIYLTHLHHTDAMFGRLAQGLSRLDRRTIFVAYGDHPPHLKTPPLKPQKRIHNTNWLFWSTDALIRSPQGSVSPHELAPHILRAVGYTPSCAMR